MAKAFLADLIFFILVDLKSAVQTFLLCKFIFMLKLTDIKEPSLLFEKDGQIKLLKWEFKRLENLAELEVLHSSHPNKIVFITPFCVARENGMETLGDEDILVIKVEEEVDISSDQLAQLTADSDIQFNKKIIPSITDDAFAEEVRKIQKKEISAGNASQVVYSRKFEGLVSRMSPMIPLILFKCLLKQQGAYITFLFSDGKGGYFVGSSPERQLEIRNGKAIKNPIAGTMPKGDKKDFQERLDLFLKDKKEINELSQILDEELKIMSQICPKGGKILGPFIRESGAVIHTEYKLVGHSHKSAIESLKASFHAPTLVGSPLKSAFRIIAKREKYSRRY